MKGLVCLGMAGLGLALASGPAQAQSAKPERANAFAKEVVAPDARDGGAGGVSVPASSEPGALAATIDQTREALGSSPNPSGRKE